MGKYYGAASSSGRSRRRAALTSAALIGVAATMIARPGFAADADDVATAAANNVVTVTAPQAHGDAKIEVDARQTSEIATSYSLTQTDIQSLTTATNADLLRSIPGVYGGYINGGIANGIGLRGWSGQGDDDDIATFTDNYRRNNLSGANSNGYNDINPLIPETIGSLDLVKGPFSVRYGGPFAFAGSLIVNTADYLPTGFSQTVGSFGETRSLPTFGYQNGDVKFYSAFEGYYINGYRQNSEDRRFNSFSKLTVPVGDGTLRTSLQLYQDNFGQPMYPLATSLATGPITQAVNPADKGSKTQFTLISNYDVDVNGFHLNANGFIDKAQTYRSASRNANLNPAVSGSALQNVEADNRWVYGAGVDVFRPFTLPGDATAAIRFGANVEEDDVAQARYPAFNNIEIPQPSDYDVAVQQVVYAGHFTESTADAYLEAQFKPVSWLKLDAGVRDDAFQYKVNVTAPSGSALPVYNAANTVVVIPGKPGTLVASNYDNTEGRATARGGIVLLPVSGLSFYANVGQGVLPNHAITDLLTNHNLNTIGLLSQEAGATYDNARTGSHVSVDTYKTNDDGDIESIGGVSTNLGKSIREGGDADASQVVYRNHGVVLKASAGVDYVYARILDTTTSPYIPGVPEWQHSYGFDLTTPVSALHLGDESVRWSFFYVFTSSVKDNASGTVEAPTYDRITSKISYFAPVWHDLQLFFGGIYYPHSVTAECCAYVSAGNIRATDPVSRLALQGGLSVKF